MGLIQLYYFNKWLNQILGLFHVCTLQQMKQLLLSQCLFIYFHCDPFQEISSLKFSISTHSESRNYKFLNIKKTLFGTAI